MPDIDIDGLQGADKLFGEVAVELDLLATSELLHALNVQQKLRRDGKPCPRIGEILVEIGFLTSADVARILERARGG